MYVTGDFGGNWPGGMQERKKNKKRDTRSKEQKSGKKAPGKVWGRGGLGRRTVTEEESNLRKFYKWIIGGVPPKVRTKLRGNYKGPELLKGNKNGM